MFIGTISAFVTDMTYTHCTVNTSYAYARSGIAFSDNRSYSYIAMTWIDDDIHCYYKDRSEKKS